MESTSFHGAQHANRCNHIREAFHRYSPPSLVILLLGAFFSLSQTDPVTDRVGKNVYHSAAGTTAFMSLVNLPLSLTLKEVLDKHADALAPSPEGIFAFSNPNRQRWGFYDVVAISPKGLKEAEEVMERGLVGIWGKDKADEFMRAIYRPHPQLNPGMPLHPSSSPPISSPSHQFHSSLHHHNVIIKVPRDAIELCCSC